MNKLKQLHFIKVKNMNEFHVQIMKIKTNIDELQIFIDDYLIIKILNSLNVKYNIWMTLLSQKIRENKKKKFFNLNILFQNFKQKKHRHIIIEKINLTHEKNN